MDHYTRFITIINCKSHKYFLVLVGLDLTTLNVGGEATT